MRNNATDSTVALCSAKTKPREKSPTTKNTHIHTRNHVPRSKLLIRAGARVVFWAESAQVQVRLGPIPIHHVDGCRPAALAQGREGQRHVIHSSVGAKLPKEVDETLVTRGKDVVVPVQPSQAEPVPHTQNTVWYGTNAHNGQHVGEAMSTVPTPKRTGSCFVPSCTSDCVPATWSTTQCPPGK